MKRRIIQVLVSIAGVAVTTWFGHAVLPVNATTIGFAYLLLILIVASLVTGRSQATIGE